MTDSREEAYFASAADVRWLRSLRARERTLLSPVKGRVEHPDVPRDPPENWVKITSTAKTAGRYPGIWSWYDSNAKAWNDDATALWVVTPNGETLQLSTYYRAVALEDVNGVAVYMTVEADDLTPPTGTTKYGTSNSLSVEPTSDISLPTLTITGKPTWTPGAGLYPMEWNQVDSTLWVWNGSAWVGEKYGSDGYGSPLTTKGDIWIYSTTDTRLPVGTDGYLLGGNSTTTEGLAYYELTSSDASVTITVSTGANTIDLKAAGTSTTGTGGSAYNTAGMTLTSASYVDVTSLTTGALAAGKWKIDGRVTAQWGAAGAAETVTAQLTDGTNVIDVDVVAVSTGASSTHGNLFLQGRVNPAGSTTYKLQAKTSSGNAVTVTGSLVWVKLA